MDLNPIFNILESSAAWAGLIPGNDESVNKHLSGKTRKDNQMLCLDLMQLANVFSRSRIYLPVQYRHISFDDSFTLENVGQGELTQTSTTVKPQST